MDRGSAGTNYSTSSAQYDTSASSARHSSSSTLPSSLDDPDNGDLYPIRKAQSAQMITGPLAAEPKETKTPKKTRAMSFGLRLQRDSVVAPENAATPLANPPAIISAGGSVSQPSSPPQIDRQLGNADVHNGRDRAMTTSSYASTAKPLQIDTSLGEQDFGGDFGNIFEGLGDYKTKRSTPSSALSKASQDNLRSISVAPSSRPSLSSQASTNVVPETLGLQTSASNKRYSWESRGSSENLISAHQSEIGLPTAESNAAMGLLGLSTGYQQVTSRTSTPSLHDEHEGNSPGASAPRPYGALAHGSEERLVWKTQLRRPTGEQPPAGINDDGLVKSNSGNLTDDTVTPRSKKVTTDIDHDDSPLFDDSPNTIGNRTISPRKQRATTDVTPKRMTRVQFEQARKEPASNRNTYIPKGSPQQDDDAKSVDSNSAEDVDDDMDDAERQRNLSKQRQRQEVTMSIYRQQMKKVTGGSGNLSGLPSQYPRPGLERSSMSNLSQSMSTIHLGGVSPGEAELEEDEDVPLGILQAHGFPTRSRPPSAPPGASPGYSASVAGNELGGELPAFARKFPQDPYFGASLINATNRESLAYGSGSPSQAGGLVGVIAGEERAKAARRGSVNPVTGSIGQMMPLPNNVGGMMPSYGRSQSMASLAGPQMSPSGFMPQMGATPGLPMNMAAPISQLEQAQMSTQQQMAQLMEMQTQMMQQMMALQSGMPVQNMQMMGMNSPDNDSRRMSMAPSLANQGRSMSLMGPPPMWNNAQRPFYAGSVHGMSTGPAAGYTPSIAPSERSNIGMPSRYRPVSTLEPSAAAPSTVTNTNHNRSSTMTSLSTNMASGRRSPSAMSALSPLGQSNGNTSKMPPRPTSSSTIKFVGASRGSSPKLMSVADRDDEDDDAAGWAEMARKRDALKAKRAQREGPGLALDEAGLSSMIYNAE